MTKPQYPKVTILKEGEQDIKEIVELLYRMQDEPLQMGDVDYAGGALAMYEWLIGISEPPILKSYWR